MSGTCTITSTEASSAAVTPEELAQKAAIAGSASQSFATLYVTQAGNRTPFHLSVGAGFCTILPSGSSANNGVLTLSTALPTGLTQTFGRLPADALYTGSAAGLWYMTGSGVDWVATDDRYTGGAIEFPASPTPLVCTGTGAYTQTTGAAIELFSVQIPALAAGDSFTYDGVYMYAGSANVKTIGSTYGSSACMAYATASASAIVANINNYLTNISATQQIAQKNYNKGNITDLPVLISEDSTIPQPFATTGQLASAADWMVFSPGRFVVYPS